MGLRKKLLLVAPSISDPLTLLDLTSRLAHYLAHLDVRRITIPVDAELGGSADWMVNAKPPAGIDERAVARIERIVDRIQLVTSAAELERAVSTSDVLGFWDIRARGSEPWQTFAKRFRDSKTCFNIDWQRTRNDGRWFADIATLWASESRRPDPADARRFQERTNGLHGSSAAYVIGTGPSARAALDVDFSGSVRIVCNTIVLDETLMAHVRPDIVTFADPIFHFGPSTYTYAFQDALRRQAEIHDFTIVTLEHFAGLLRDRLPEFRDRVIGVRLGKPSWPQNYDLTRHLAVKPYPNILTMLMIPLAATFSQTIRLIGFDGRGATEKYFWKHGETVQLDRELAEIRRAHPGFFQLDYADYYDTHVAALEQMCLDVELRGVAIQPQTPSAMMPLRRRAPGSISAPHVQPAARSPLIVSITPDWTGDFGHFGPWERTVRSAARAQGYEYRTLASRALSVDDVWVVPTFTHGTVGREGARLEQFERDLRDGLDCVAGTQPAIVSFYVASVWHLPAVLRIARERPTTTFVVNLMRSHQQITDGDLRTSIPLRLLVECLEVARGTNVHICIDSEAAQRDLEQVTGHSALVWPMVMVADPDLMWQEGRKAPDRPIHVVAPVQPQPAKGYPLLAGLAERLHHSLRTGSIALTARSAPQPTGTGARTLSQAEALQSFGGKLVDQHLTDREYASLVGRAHVVVAPYSVEFFRTRTSGVVLDAIAAGKPVVTTGGTWAGELVERLGAGQTFDDGDLDSFEFAVRRVLSDLGRYTRDVEAVRSTVVADFSPRRLLSFLAGLSYAANPTPDARHVEAVRHAAGIGVVGHWLDMVRRDTERLDYVIRQDDLERSYDNAQDQVATLRADNEQRQRELSSLRATKPIFSGTSKPASSPTNVAPPLSPLPPAQFQSAIRTREDGWLDEMSLIATLLEPASDPGVMIDVGAYRGSAFRHFLELDWIIYAFEPDPRHAAFLADTYGADDRIRLDRRAVSNITGQQLPLYVSPLSRQISGLTPFYDSCVSIGNVETIALRDIACIDRVDILKISVEGHEKFVLEGVPWERLRPNVVVAEFDHDKTNKLGYDSRDLIAFLYERGYQVWVSEWHPITEHGALPRWHQVFNSTERLPQSASWGNLIAFDSPVSRDAMSHALATVLSLSTVA